MVHIEPFRHDHLPQMQELINSHLSTIVPGWALPEVFIADRLQRNPSEYVVDPWVMERVTLCAVEKGRVCAAAHLLRYGAGPEVSESYRGVGDVAWFVAWPESTEAAAALLSATNSQMAAWRVVRAYASISGLPVPLCGGVPDVWPHIAAALAVAGYQSSPDFDEALYAGRLDRVPSAGDPPLRDMTVRRTPGDMSTRFAAIVEGQEVGHCECRADLTEGGALPALRGWAELSELWVDEGWRNHGIGAWLVRHAVAWLRLAGCDRIALAVAAKNEAAGAGRFYRRFGWDVLVREQKGWSRSGL